MFKCARNGLHITQWAICIGFSLVTIPLDYLVKFIPSKLCPELGKKQRKAIDSGVLNFRKKRSNTLSVGNAGNVHRETPKYS